MTIRIIASDLDGTLLNAESRIAPETVKTVKMAQDAGIRFVAATGRAWDTAYPIFREAGINADYLLLNGAEFRASSGEVIYQEAMEKNLAKKIMAYLTAEGIDYEVNTDIGDFATNTEVCQTALKIRDFPKIWDKEPKILKFFAFSNKLSFVEKVRNDLIDWKDISVVSSADWNVEITAAAAKKGMMLKRVADFYQVSKEEVMVFGDGENDETMFMKFSHSRAVENAVPAIRNLAEKVIESNQNNGVAKEISKIIGGLQNGIF